MIGVRQLRAGVKVFARHWRNAGGDPRRLAWVVARALRILIGGHAASVLQRHVVIGDLYRDYPEWIRKFDTVDSAARSALVAEAQALRRKPLISVLMPCFNADPAMLDAAIDSVRTQIYDRWELCIADDASTRPALRERLAAHARADSRIRLRFRDVNGGISACTNDALAMAEGEFIGFLDQDDTLSEQALFRVAEAINANPFAKLIYSDEDKLDAKGQRHSPHFKPDWNPEWERSTNYVLHFTVVAREALLACGGLDPQFDGVQDWDMVLRVSEAAALVRQLGTIVHVPRVLYHWREGIGSTASGVNQKAHIVDRQRLVIEAMLSRHGIAAVPRETLGGWRIHYSVPDPAPLVSVVIPTRDHGALLEKCVEGILQRTDYPRIELVIVDHDSTELRARALIDRLESEGNAIVVHYAGAFNYARECNLGVSRSKGDVVVLLNNDIEVIDPDWLKEMVGHAIQPGTGIVGALLLYGDDTIQHAGVIVGANGAADRPYIGYKRGYAGIAGRALAAQNVTAVITACAAVLRARYDEAGGMDESLAISHNDVDFCLRLIEKGYRNVWTPHAALYHHESASRGYDNSPEQQRQAGVEEKQFRARWGALADVDPFYNPNLALEGQLFTVAFPPRV